MIEFRDRIEIARPPQEVFAYVTDPSKLSSWQNVEEVTQLTSGPVGVGTRFREIHTAPFGKRFEELTEIVVYEPGRRLEIRVVEGPPIDGRWDFEPAGAGTRLTLTPIARLPRPVRIAKPIAEFLTALLMQRYHRRLKRVLENRD